MEKEYLVTAEGLAALQAELEQLKTVRRKQVAEKIKEARSFGDLSENSEYDEAKNEQGIVEGRIAELESIMKVVRVVDEAEIPSDVVDIGSRVAVIDDEGEQDEYVIVSSSEADPLTGKISNESPVGAALMGQRAGAVCEAVLPGGLPLRLTLLRVERR